MRRFIRLHPWRLEIVPAAAFLVAVAYTAYYHLSGAEAVLRRAAYPGEPPVQYEATIMGHICLVAFFWTIAAASNHRWVLLERRKMYNWTAAVFQFTILGNAGIAVFLARTGLPGITPTTVAVDVDVIPAIALLGIAVTAALEWTRRFVPREYAAEPDPPPPTMVYTDDSFRYVETGLEWEWAILGAGVFALGIGATAYGGITLSGVLSAVAGVFFCSLSRRRLETSSHRVVMWNGLYRVQVALADAASCKATSDENGQRPSETSRKKWHQFSWNTGRCLEIATKQGHIYRFGMIRPQYARSLIESVIDVGKSDPEPAE
ncbi:MAG: hypothetical protein Q7T82_05175 [Armatimonadota bacterium]|nr:hypothetical protein [Armatimonadota bacterium]